MRLETTQQIMGSHTDLSAGAVVDVVRNAYCVRGEACNVLNRNSAFSDVCRGAACCAPTPVSIPQSEFSVFGRLCWISGHYSVGKFQFLNRNSVCSDRTFPTPLCPPGSKFQFLNRNSVCSDVSGKVVTRRVMPKFQFLNRNSVCSD